MFDGILSDADACRATMVVEGLLVHGFRGALTGGLAIQAHLRAQGHALRPRPLNDIDFVADGFASIPAGLAEHFLLNHVHPFAPDGKTLIQLIDSKRAVRVDVFRASGATLLRAGRLSIDTGVLDVITLEDLLAKTISYAYGRLRTGRPIDPKYVRSFLELTECGDEQLLDQAWEDHRDHARCSWREASSFARRVLGLHPELVVPEQYSHVVPHCERCQDFGPFRCAPPERIVEILGYC